jgi:hypothetical protein
MRPYVLGTAQPNRLHYQPHQRRHETLHAAEIGFERDNQGRAINLGEERILIRSERDEIGREALPIVHGQHGLSSILPWSSAHIGAPLITSSPPQFACASRAIFRRHDNAEWRDSLSNGVAAPPSCAPAKG